MGSDMPASFIIGLVIVLVGFAAARMTLFETRTRETSDSPARRTTTVPAAAADGTAGVAVGGVGAAFGMGHPAVRSDVRIRWWQRLRAGVLLTLITVGFGMAIGGAFGLVALLLSVALGD